VVNDVASLNIDAALIADVSDDTLSLANGCVCCSQSAGAARALLDAVARDPTPELLLLETSGVADPGTVAHAVASLPGIVVDCVVTAVDAAAAASPPALAFLLERQVAAADLVLVNKTDLVDGATATQIAQRVARVEAENRQLREELADAEQKLEAITSIERSIRAQENNPN